MSVRNEKCSVTMNDGERRKSYGYSRLHPPFFSIDFRHLGHTYSNKEKEAPCQVGIGTGSATHSEGEVAVLMTIDALSKDFYSVHNL